MSLVITKKALDVQLQRAFSEVKDSENYKVFSKVINVGMLPYGRRLVTKFPVIKEFRTFHVRVSDETKDPSEWLTPTNLARLTAVVCELLVAQVKIHGDVQVFDIKKGRCVDVRDFCKSEVLRDGFQRYLFGRCANAKYSGSRTLNLCTHFGVCFARSERT